MKGEWLTHSLHLASGREDFYSGARKIIRNVEFTIRNFNDDLSMGDCGFTKSKMSMLIRNYVHEESILAAIKLWEDRKLKDKYGSVGFTGYNHFIKGDVGGHTPRGSKMGPCIQAVTLTLLTSPKRATAVDVFYRTTELFKKFPADLVFIRDVLLPRFDFGRYPLQEVNFHFANVTCHPMYFVTLLPLLDDPIAALNSLKKKDKFMFQWVVKWTARYLCDEHHRGIEKFMQAQRVKKDARERIKKPMQKTLAAYLRKNHPGHRNAYEGGDEEE